MGLNYSLVYTPSKDLRRVVNYLYADNKVHFRFKNFESSETITGFEKKLNYLMTYLFNYAYSPSIRITSTKDIIKDFLSSSDVAQIYNVMKLNIVDKKFKGFKVNLNYSLTKNEDDIKDVSPFGSMNEKCAPLQKLNKKYVEGSLQTFLEVLRIDLNSYLFNDGYSVVINNKGKVKDKDKLIKKQNKKYEAATADVVKLW